MYIFNYSKLTKLPDDAMPVIVVFLYVQTQSNIPFKSNTCTVVLTIIIVLNFYSSQRELQITVMTKRLLQRKTHPVTLATVGEL